MPLKQSLNSTFFHGGMSRTLITQYSPGKSKAHKWMLCKQRRERTWLYPGENFPCVAAVITLFIAVITATHLRTNIFSLTYYTKRGKGEQANPLICRNAPEGIRPGLIHAAGRNTRKADDDAPYTRSVFVLRNYAIDRRALIKRPKAASLPIHQRYVSK